MTAEQPAARIYSLRDGVRIFRSGEEIRFRKGVWSYNEATVRLGGQPEPVVAFFGALFEALAGAGEADAEALGRAAGASPAEVESCCEVLESLRRQQFLHAAGEPDVTRVVSALLGGNLSGFEEYVGSVRPVLFFADAEPAAGAARTMAAETGLPLDRLDGEVLRELAAADLTSRTDAVAHHEAMARFERQFASYACVIGCVASPELTLLRNLNRVLIQAGKPLILGLIDGPFLSILSTLATRTGCFECYEQRMLARLEDTLVYHRFVESAAGGGKGGGAFSPALHLLTAAALSEGFLYSALGVQRLAGRVINVYLPLLEVQVEDLLRVPYCPACGFVSKARMNEMYTSSKRLVADMLERVEVEE